MLLHEFCNTLNYTGLSSNPDHAIAETTGKPFENSGARNKKLLAVEEEDGTFDC
jgi:hypothetical protein